MIDVRHVNDHRPGAALDNRTGGGGFPNIEESTLTLIAYYVFKIYIYVYIYIYIYILTQGGYKIDGEDT